MADETPQEMIEETVRQPASASIDGKSATSQDISKLIEADKYLAAKAAAQARRTGIRFTKVVGGAFES